MTTRGYLQQVESRDIKKCDSRDVTECTSDAIVLVVDNKRSTSLDAPSIPHLSFASTEPTRVLYLRNI